MVKGFREQGLPIIELRSCPACLLTDVGDVGAAYVGFECMAFRELLQGLGP